MGSFTFQVVDYVVFLGILLSSAAIGVGFSLADRRRGRVVSAQNYLMGDRKLPLLPVAISLLVSFQSAILILGTTSEVYLRGTTWWWSGIGASLSAALTCYLFVPVFYHLRLTSVYEYLEARFESRLVRRLGAVLYISVSVIYLAIAMYAPSVALEQVTSILPLWVLILIAGVLCTFYVVIGGLKAVVWTDAVQAVFMVAGMVAIAVKGTMAVGGMDKVFEISRERGRLIYFDPRADPFIYMSSWIAVIGQLFSWLGWYGINQSSVQRYCAMQNVRKGQLALLFNIPGFISFLTLACYCGLVMFAYWADCDPLSAHMVQDRDQLLPLYVMDVLASVPGIPGLFVACLYAGTLSTVSSGLNSLSAVTYEDILKPYVLKWPAQKLTLLTRMLCLMFGVISTSLAFLAPYMGGVLQAALSGMGAVNGPLTGMFLVGVMLPWVSKRGVLLGALCSALIMLWLCVSALSSNSHFEFLPVNTSECPEMYGIQANATILNPPQIRTGFSKIYSLSPGLYDTLGILIVFLVSVPVSFICGRVDVESLDPKLLHPWVRPRAKPGTRQEFLPLKAHINGTSSDSSPDT